MGKFGGVTILILFLVVMFFRQAIGLYVDWLWFQDVGYGQSLCNDLIVQIRPRRFRRRAFGAVDLCQFEDRLFVIGRISLLQCGKHY